LKRQQKILSNIIPSQNLNETFSNERSTEAFYKRL